MNTPGAQRPPPALRRVSTRSAFQRHRQGGRAQLVPPTAKMPRPVERQRRARRSRRSGPTRPRSDAGAEPLDQPTSPSTTDTRGPSLRSALGRRHWAGSGPPWWTPRPIYGLRSPQVPSSVKPHAWPRSEPGWEPIAATRPVDRQGQVLSAPVYQGGWRYGPSSPPGRRGHMMRAGDGRSSLCWTRIRASRGRG